MPDATCECLARTPMRAESAWSGLRRNLVDWHARGGVAELAYAGDLKSLAFGIVGSSPTAPTRLQTGSCGSPFLIWAPRGGSNPRGRGAERTRERSPRSAQGGAAAAADAGGAADRRVPPPLPGYVTGFLREPVSHLGAARGREPASETPGPAQRLQRFSTFFPLRAAKPSKKVDIVYHNEKRCPAVARMGL